MAEPRMQSESASPPLPNLSGTTVGRFTIEELLGKGGMGEVYRAYDTRLKRQVALKRIAPALRDDEHSRQRLWKEAEWASRLSDPHIAAVHDVIEEENELFIVMEYVAGQTLRRRLARPLAVDEFLPFATECALALASAHKVGVRHGDIKPENIVLTPSGQVKVLDFGVAKNLPGRSETTTLGTRGGPEFAGTLPYMAPEVVEEKESDARADIFSLGVVFYESLTGRNPFRAESFVATCDRVLHSDPLPLQELIEAVPAELERIISKMLAKDPAQRYSSAADLTVDLEALRRVSSTSRSASDRQDVAPSRARRRWSALGVVATVASLAVAIPLVYRYVNRPVLAEHAPVLLTEVENQTREKLFDHTATEAMRQTLAQSRYVHLVPQAQVLEATERMGKKNVPNLDAALGREICRRENYAALLAGRITEDGGMYRLTVQIVDPIEGAPVRTETATLRSPAELYGVVDEMGKTLRKRLGESLAQISKSSEPLARVTTSSLEALQRYSRAMEFYAAKDFENFLPLARSAVELDPNFAMAHLYLARALEWQGREESAREQMAKARQNLDHVTERERYLILAYDDELQGQYEKAAEQYRLLTQVYPDDLAGYSGLANASLWTGRPTEGLAALQHAITLNPRSVNVNQGLIFYLLRLNRFAEALSAFGAAKAQGIRSPKLHWGAGLAYLGADNSEAARAEFELLRKEGGPYDESLAALYLARVLMYEGRLREAADSLRSGLVLSEKLHSETWIPVHHYLLAQVLSARAQSSEARAEVRRLAQAASAPPQEGELRRAGLMAARLGDLKTAQQLLARLGKLAAQRDSGYTKSCHANLKGAVEFASGEVEAAIESQRRAALYFPSYQAQAALGNAYAARQDWRSSAEAYQHYLDFKGEILDEDSPAEWVLAHLALARVLAKAGDTQRALRSYDEFLRLWARADSDLQALREARAEREQLSRSSALHTSATRALPRAM